MTVAIVACGEAIPDTYLPEVERLLATRFRYFEILAVATALDERVLSETEARMAGRRNGRLVVLDGAPSPERLSYAAASESLGDYVAVIHPDEISPEEAIGLLMAGVTGHDVVRLGLSLDARPLLDRIVTRTAASTLRLLTGRTIRPEAGRSICLSRSAVAAVRDHHADGRFMRFVDGPWSHAGSVQMMSTGARRRGRPRDYYRRTLLGLGMIAQAMPRILFGVSLMSFALSVGSLAYGAYAGAAWLLVPGVAKGWTSLSLVMAALFGALFLVLGFIALGMVRLFDEMGVPRTYRVERETSTLDMFRTPAPLNVEGVGGAIP